MKVCVHEAGHAVIARVLGLKGGEVTVRKPRSRRQSEPMGSAAIEAPDDAASRWQREGKDWREGVYAFCISAQAGWEAQRLLLYVDDAGGRDFTDRETVALALYAASDKEQRRERRLRLRAIRLVHLHRQEIECVANALNKYGTLSDRQVRRIMKDTRAAGGGSRSARGKGASIEL